MSDRIIVGADEAGYGPNIGPLLIVATAWSVPETMTNDEFSAGLASTFEMQSWSSGCSHVPLGDSKQLFQPSVGLGSLEAGLLALMQQVDAPKLGNFANNLRTFKQFVEWPPVSGGRGNTEAAENEQESEGCAPWYEELEQWPVPVFHSKNEIDRLAEVARIGLQKHGIRLVGCRAAIVTESAFNASVALCGSKGQLLSSKTLELVRSFCEDDPRCIEVFCDRQGGRKNYLPVLLAAMPDEWFIETAQSTTRCSYRNTSGPRRDFHFTVGGDNFAPTALASMLAKYMRERLMHSINHFWKQHVPDLKPTAGYPLDAKRFRYEIEATAKRLELPEASWWRSR